MRICLFGGAGTGKSTLAAKIFAKMKSNEYSCELVQEFIKPWAYQKRFPKSFDQLFIFASQLHAEDTFVHHVDHVVTDSPLLLQCAYAQHYNFFGADELVSLALKFEEKYPSLNFLLERGENTYKENEGRFQNIEEAKIIDEKILRMLVGHVDFHPVNYKDFDKIIDIIDENINHFHFVDATYSLHCYGFIDKIQAIKSLRELLGIGLMEAKIAIEESNVKPILLMKNSTYFEVKELADKLTGMRTDIVKD